MTTTTNPSILDTQFVYLEIADGIVIVTYKKGITITLDVAKEIVRTRMEFTSNTLYPMLVLDEGVVSAEKSARDYFSNEGTKGLTAGAFVLKSVYSTFLINFYLKVTNPKVPFKIFTDKGKALEWLGQFKGTA